MTHQTITSQPATHGAFVSAQVPAGPATPVQDLRLCLHRLHGRQAQALPVRIGNEGLALGADSDLFTAGAAQNHCIAKLHGVIRPHPNGWWLEPGTKDMVLALNDGKIAWGDGRLLHPGDKIDMGFASLLVENNDETPRLLQPRQDAGAVRDVQEIHDVPWQKLFLPAPAQALPEQIWPEQAMPEQAVPEQILPEQAMPEQIWPPSVATDVPCPADELCALLAEDARNSTSREALQYALPYVVPPAQPAEEGPLRCASDVHLRGHCDDFGPAFVPMPELAPQFDPNDPLAALAAESARVLACGGDFRPTHNMAMAHQQAGNAHEQPMPEDPLAHLAPTASLEDILEGPLSIDHVLDKLRAGSGQSSTAHNSQDFLDSQNSQNALDSLAEHARTPDPLLLLAGMETQILREPELAPVLHKEHRTTSLHTAYTFSVRKDETIQEAPWTDHKA